MSEDDPRLTDPSVDRAMTGLEALADQWAVEVDLPKMIDNLALRLNRNAPDDIREAFIARQAKQIDAIVKQAYIEGAYRAAMGAFDAVRSGYDPSGKAQST